MPTSHAQSVRETGRAVGESHVSVTIVGPSEQTFELLIDAENWLNRIKENNQCE